MDSAARNLWEWFLNQCWDCRTVRRAQSHSLDSNRAWVNQSIVMRADALDNETHKCWGAHPDVPVDYYGATPWCEWLAFTVALPCTVCC